MIYHQYYDAIWYYYHIPLDSLLFPWTKSQGSKHRSNSTCRGKAPASTRRSTIHSLERSSGEEQVVVPGDASVVGKWLWRPPGDVCWFVNHSSCDFFNHSNSAFQSFFNNVIRGRFHAKFPFFSSAAFVGHLGRAVLTTLMRSCLKAKAMEWNSEEPGFQLVGGQNHSKLEGKRAAKLHLIVKKSPGI